MSSYIPRPASAPSQPFAQTNPFEFAREHTIRDDWALRLDPETDTPDRLRAGAFAIMSEGFGIKDPTGRVFSGAQQNALDPKEYFAKARACWDAGSLAPVQSEGWNAYHDAAENGDRATMRRLARENIRGEDAGNDVAAAWDPAMSRIGLKDDLDMERELLSVRDVLTPEEIAIIEESGRARAEKTAQTEFASDTFDEDFYENASAFDFMFARNKDLRDEETKARHAEANSRLAEVYRRHANDIRDEQRLPAYEKQLADENLWATVQGLRGAVSDDAWRVVEMAQQSAGSPTQKRVLDAFEKLTTTEQRSIAGVLHALHYGRDTTLVGDAFRSFWDTAAQTVGGSARAIADVFRRGVMDGKEYRDMVERRALLEQANSVRMKEWGYLGQSVVGAFSTIPYMAVAAIPYAGTAAIMASASDQFQTEAALNGVDVGSREFMLTNWAFSGAYAAVEKLQIVPFKPLKNVSRRQMYCEMFHSLRSALFVAGVVAGTTVSESVEEGIQGGIERVVEGWGLGHDQAKEFAAGFASDFVGSLGTMAIIGAVGAGVQHHRYRSGAFSPEEAISATARVADLESRIKGHPEDAAVPLGEFSREYGMLGRDWVNAGTDGTARVRALLRWGFTPEQATRLHGMFSEIWKGVSGDEDARSEFVGGNRVRSAAELLADTLGVQVEDGENGEKSVSFRIGRGRVKLRFNPADHIETAVDVNDRTQAADVVEILNRNEEATTGTRGTMTVDEWLALPEEVRREQTKGMTVQGGFKIDAPDGTSVGEDALRVLSGRVIETDVALPQTVFHESMHAVLRLLREEAAADPEAKALQEELAKVYAPQEGIDEAVNEEALADGYQTYLTSLTTAVEDTGVFARLKRWIARLLGRATVARDSLRAAQSAQGRLFNLALTGDITPAMRKEEEAKPAPEGPSPAPEGPSSGPSSAPSPAPSAARERLAALEAELAATPEGEVALRQRLENRIAEARRKVEREGGGTRASISGLYTGSAADYAERVPVLDKDGNVTGYRIDNAPSLRHVGSGEGSQVYGWGLYGSNVRGVAEGYAKQSETNPEILDQQNRSAFDPTGDDVADEARKALASMYIAGAESVDKAVGMALARLREKGEAKSADWLKEHSSEFHVGRRRNANVYEQTFFTDREPGDESHLLKWYEEVPRDTFDRIVSALKEEGRWGERDGGRDILGRPETIYGTLYGAMRHSGGEWTGGDVYELVRAQLGADENHGAREASEWLAAHGIDGVKYPVDSFGGKGVKDGDKVGWNYVSFRDDNIRVDHKWVDGEQRYSITPAEDAAYMDAVQSGDMETAQRMVREAAAKAMPNTKVVDEDGLPKVVYHGTPLGGFTEFDTDGTRKVGITGAWFSDDSTYSQDFARKQRFNGRIPNGAGIYGVFLNLQNPDVLYAEGSDYSNVLDGYKVDYFLFLSEEVAKEFAERHGLEMEETTVSYDELVHYIREKRDWETNPHSSKKSEALFRTNEKVWKSWEQTFDYFRALEKDFEQVGIPKDADGTMVFGMTDGVEATNQYVAFRPNQIKSADPVTYNDAGNVIPLSQRFNPERDDIRYAVAARPSPEFAMDGTIADALPAHLREDARAIIEERAGTPEWMADPDGTPTDLSERDWLRREAERRHNAPRFVVKQKQAGVDYPDAGEEIKKIDRPLIAMHGIDEGRLLKAIAEGAFVMPSISVTRPNTGSTRSGGDKNPVFVAFDGSVVGSQSTAKLNGDAGTPMIDDLHGDFSDANIRRVWAEWWNSNDRGFKRQVGNPERSLEQYRDFIYGRGEMADKYQPAEAKANFRVPFSATTVFISPKTKPAIKAKIKAAGFKNVVEVDTKDLDAVRKAEEQHATRFAVGARRRAAYEDVLARKRPDLDADAVLKELDKLDDPKKEKLALHWVVRGSLLLPQDAYKIDDALDVAAKAKVDPFAYKSPDELLLANKQFKPSARPIDPATVPELSDPRDEGDGIVSYEVQDDRQGQAAMRRVIDTHWGEDANPWCLLAKQGGGEFVTDEYRAWIRRDPHWTPDDWFIESNRNRYEKETGKKAFVRTGWNLDGAWNFWQHYSALPKRVAFKDGKLLAFMATDNEAEEARESALPNYVRRDYTGWLRSHDFDEEYDRDEHIEQFLTEEYPDLKPRAEEEWWDRQDESHPDLDWARDDSRYQISGAVGAEELGILGTRVAEAERAAGDVARASVVWNGPAYSYKSFATAYAARDRILGIDRPDDDYRRLLETMGVRDYSVDDLKADAEKIRARGLGRNEATLQRLAGLAEQESMARTVESLMRGSLELGEDVGSSARRAYETYLARMRRTAKGRDYTDLTADLGFDLADLALAIDPEAFAPKPKPEGDATPPAGGSDAEVAALLDGKAADFGLTEEQLRERIQERMEQRTQEIRERLERIRARLDEWRAKEALRKAKLAERQEAEGKSDAPADVPDAEMFDAEQNETEAGAKRLADYESECVEEMPDFRAFLEECRRDGLDLSDAAEFVAAVRIWSEDFIARETGADPENVLRDPVNLARYRATMMEFLHGMADAMLDPEDGAAAKTAERMMQEIPSDATVGEIDGRARTIVGFIQRNGIRQTRKQLIRELRKGIKLEAIRGKKWDEMERDAGRKVTGEREAAARYLYRILTWSDGMIAKESARLHDIVAGREDAYRSAGADDAALKDLARTDREVHRAAEKLQALQMYGGLRKKSPAEIKLAARAIMSWLTEEREAHEKRWNDWHARLDALAQRAAKAASASAQDYTPEDPGYVGKLADELTATIRQRLEQLFVGGGDDARAVIDEVMRIVYAGSERMRAETAAARRRTDEMLARCVQGTGRKVRQFLKDLDAPIPEDLNRQLRTAEQPVRMTNGQALQLLASLEQVASYAGNIEANGRGSERVVGTDPDGNPITEPQTPHAELLRRYFADKPAMVRLLEGMREVYEERRGALSDTFRAVTGNPILAPDPLYAPVKMFRGSSEGFETQVRAWDPFGPALQPRIKNTLDFDLSASIMDVYNNRTRETCRAIAWGIPGMELRSVLCRKEVQDAIARTHGKFPLRQLVAHLTDLVSDGWADEPSGFKWLAQKLGGATTYSALSWNVVTALKQTASIPAWTALMDGGYAEVFRNIANFDRAAARELMDAPGFAARYGSTSFGRMFKDAIRDPNANPLQRFFQAGMTAVQMGDFVPGILVGTGVYKAKKLALMRQGLEERQAREEAARIAWGLIEECQQSSRLENSPAFLRRGGFLARQAAKFASSPLLQVSHEVHTLRMWAAEAKAEARRNGGGVRMMSDSEDVARWRRRFVNQLICNHVLMPVAFYGIATMFNIALGSEPPDEEEVLGDLAMQTIVGPFGRIFLLGMIFDKGGEAVARAMGGKPNVYDSTGLAAQQYIQKIVGQLGRIGGDVADADWESVRDDLLKMLGQVSAPARYAVKIGQNAAGYDPAEARRERKAEIRRERGE